jgi:tRNA(Ile)-lysidine synthetase-like protein
MIKLDLDKTKKYLLAVSAGVDSICLMDLLKRQNYQFELAHVNYNLRKESYKDKKTIEKYAKQNKLKFHYYEVDQEPKGNVQNWARQIRYNFFTEIVNQNGLEAVLVAHHQNDTIENVMLTLFDNKNISGEIGIKEKSNIGDLQVIRPLLNVKKSQLYDYAIKNNLEYNEDITNTNSKYKRNYVRKFLSESQNNFDNHEQSVIDFMNYHNYLLLKTPPLYRIFKEDDITNSLRLFCYQNKITFHGKYVQTINDLFSSNKRSNYVFQDKIHFVLENNQIKLFTSEFQDYSTSSESETLQTNPKAYIKLANGRKSIRRFYIDQKINRYYRNNIKFITNDQNQILSIPYLNLSFKEKNEKK